MICFDGCGGVAVEWSEEVLLATLLGITLCCETSTSCQHCNVSGIPVHTTRKPTRPAHVNPTNVMMSLAAHLPPRSLRCPCAWRKPARHKAPPSPSHLPLQTGVGRHPCWRCPFASPPICHPAPLETAHVMIPPPAGQPLWSKRQPLRHAAPSTAPYWPAAAASRGAVTRAMSSWAPTPGYTLSKQATM